MDQTNIFNKRKKIMGGRPGRWHYAYDNSVEFTTKSTTNTYCFELTTKEYELVKLYVEALHRKIEG